MTDLSIVSQPPVIRLDVPAKAGTRIRSAFSTLIPAPSAPEMDPRLRGDDGEGRRDDGDGRGDDEARGDDEVRSEDRVGRGAHERRGVDNERRAGAKDGGRA